MAGATGLEPATSGVTGRRSNQLSYAPAGESGTYSRCNVASSLRSRHAKLRKSPILREESIVTAAPNRLLRLGDWWFPITTGNEEGPLMAMVPGNKAPTPPTVTLKHLAAAMAEQ